MSGMAAVAALLGAISLHVGGNLPRFDIRHVSESGQALSAECINVRDTPEYKDAKRVVSLRGDKIDFPLQGKSMLREYTRTGIDVGGVPIKPFIKSGSDFDINIGAKLVCGRLTEILNPHTGLLASLDNFVVNRIHADVGPQLGSCGRALLGTIPDQASGNKGECGGGKSGNSILLRNDVSVEAPPTSVAKKDDDTLERGIVMLIGIGALFAIYTKLKYR